MNPKPFLFYIALVFLAMSTAAAHAQTGIVMDNEDATLEGVWTNGIAAADKFGKDYRFAFCTGKNATASATYRPKIFTPGHYDVEIFYARGANRSIKAPWFISYADGSFTTNVNQQIQGGVWVRIGSNLAFTPGTAGFVRLSNNTSETDETSYGRPVVVADGVRFVPSTGTAATSDVSPASAVEVNDEAVVLSGDWIGVKSDVQRGQSIHYTTTKETPTATATFRPDLPKAGRYHVEAWHASGSNRATNAPWTIVGADGETLAFVNQVKNNGEWVRLASDKLFAAGSDGYARLHNGTGRTGSVVVADAVRFIPAESHPNTPAVVPVKPGATHALKLTILGGGSVTRSPDALRYPGNATVTLTAKADAGFVFGGWTGDVNRMKNPLPLAMSADRTITANFWAAGIGVIMDNTEAEFLGDWMAPQQVWGGRYDNYLYASAVAGQSNASATYRPKLPRSGLYDIYIWYHSGENRATKTSWEIVSPSGTKAVSIDQQKHGGAWVLLAASIEFAEGDKGYVRVKNTAEPVPSVVVADAVAFVFIAAQ